MGPTIERWRVPECPRCGAWSRWDLRNVAGELRAECAGCGHVETIAGVPVEQLVLPTTKNPTMRLACPACAGIDFLRSEDSRSLACTKCAAVWGESQLITHATRSA